MRVLLPTFCPPHPARCALPRPHRWLEVRKQSPMTRQPISSRLVPNHSLRSSIMEWKAGGQPAPL